MSGKLCTGSSENNIGAARLSQSKAFCEGVAYRSQGASLSFPRTGNPHVNGSSDYQAWDAGWMVVEGQVASPIDPATAPCCAVSDVVIVA